MVTGIPLMRIAEKNGLGGSEDANFDLPKYMYYIGEDHVII